VLRAFEGLSNQETARLLHIRPDAASQRYGRALLRLRQFLVDLGISEASS
jgi:DNA-directed RNA polymerase specialized sigma24 family protein